MSGRHSRTKGANLERRVAHLLQEHGFAAEKLSRTGYTGTDLSIPLIGRDHKAEVKVRGTGFRQLYGWLADADMLIVKSDRRASCS
jgi:Holliday junction resolvase